MDFKYQATTKVLRGQLRGHLSKAAHGGREPSEPQSIAWGLLNDFDEAVLVLRQCQVLMGKDKGLAVEIQEFLRVRG